MKIKILLILFFALFMMAKTNAQTNNDEAVATFQMAQEKFDQGKYADAFNYLNKVDSLNPSAKTKTSYLKAKCAYKYSIESSHQNFFNDSIVYNYCLYYIKYYFDNGKDEDKKSELLKIKIEVENSEGYKNYLSTAKKNKLLYEKNKLLSEKYENMSSTDALNIIKNIMERNPLSDKSKSNYVVQNPELSFPKECVLQVVLRQFDSRRVVDSYGDADLISGDLYIYTVLLTSVYMKDETIEKNNNDAIQEVWGDYFYKSLSMFNKKSELDIQNYNNGTNKTHAYKGLEDKHIDEFYLPTLCKEDISDNDKTDLKMAFNVLIKNCGGGVKK